MSDCPLPSWAKGLKKYGTYYEGVISDAESVLELHKKETVTTFGIRRTEKHACNKENKNPAETNLGMYSSYQHVHVYNSKITQ